MNPLEAFRRLWKGKDPTFLSELTTPQRATLSVLVSHSDGNGLSFPGLDTIAASSGLGRSTVIRCLGQLEDMGLVSREVNPPSPTRYTVSLRDRPRAGPSHSETETVPERDRDRPAAGPEVPSEVPSEVPTPPEGESADADPDQMGADELVATWINALGSRPAGVSKQAAVAKRLTKAYDRTTIIRAVDGIQQLFPHSDGEPWDLFDLEKKFTKATTARRNGREGTTQQAELDEDDLAAWNPISGDKATRRRGGPS